MKAIRWLGYLLMGYLIYQIYQLLSANADRIAGMMGAGGGGRGARSESYGAQGQNMTGPGEGMRVDVQTQYGGEYSERVGRGVVRR